MAAGWGRSVRKVVKEGSVCEKDVSSFAAFAYNLIKFVSLPQ
jgi:hypothetical protein